MCEPTEHLFGAVWRSTGIVNSLSHCHGFIGASRIAVLQCGTVCHQPCAKTCHWLHLRQNWKRIFSGVHSDSRRPLGAVAAFSRCRRRDISDFTYLLNYLPSSVNGSFESTNRVEGRKEGRNNDATRAPEPQRRAPATWQPHSTVNTRPCHTLQLADPMTGSVVRLSWVAHDTCPSISRYCWPRKIGRLLSAEFCLHDVCQVAIPLAISFSFCRFTFLFR